MQHHGVDVVKDASVDPLLTKDFSTRGLFCSLVVRVNPFKPRLSQQSPFTIKSLENEGVGGASAAFHQRVG